MSAIEADDVNFSYGAVRILTDVSITVEEGEVLGVLGPNGAGKSTLLGVLAGDLRARGNILLFGQKIEDYRRPQLARVRSFMEQSSEFPFAYRARDIVAMGRTCWNSSQRENDEAVDAALRAVEGEDLADREVTKLSGGEKARVTLARVLAQQARIVFLDEPTAALDIAHRERSLELCADLAREGCAVVAVMHDIQVAASHCDKIALMDAGRIVAVGDPKTVLTAERLTNVYGWPIDVRDLGGGALAAVPARRAPGKGGRS